jgi:hypothetical protein
MHPAGINEAFYINYLRALEFDLLEVFGRDYDILLWLEFVLGHRAWTLRPHLRLALLITHGVLLLPGSLAVVAGVHAMRAAEHSNAHGGGLLSPLAALSLAFGIPVLVLALCSIATALSMAPSMWGAKRGS